MKTITQTRFGPTDVLRLVDIPQPLPGPAEALVEVRATSVNPVDLAVRSGDFPLLHPPFTLGWDLSGVVRDVVPPTATTFAPGVEVIGLARFPAAGSTNAEYTTVPIGDLAPKPSNLSHAEAAVLPLVGLTAWQTLVDLAQVGPHSRVLIHGGGGGVGHVAVQLARALGAEVTATARGTKREWVAELGASTTIDPSQESLSDTGPYDVVLDTVGGTFEDSIPAMSDGGVFVTIVDQFDASLPERAAAAGRRAVGHIVEADGRALRSLVALVEDGAVRPHVEAVFPLDRLGAAHERLAAGGLRGKIAIEISA